MKVFKEQFYCGIVIGLFLLIIICMFVVKPETGHVANVSKVEKNANYIYESPTEYTLYDDEIQKGYFIVKTDKPCIKDNLAVAIREYEGNDIEISDYELLKEEDGYYYYKFPVNDYINGNQYYGADIKID